MNEPALVLFRNDRRVADNGALAAAAQTGRPVIAAFILDEGNGGGRAYGGAAHWWLHHSLAALSRDLAALGVPLILRAGPSAPTVDSLLRETGATTVFWNRRYDPDGVVVDSQMKRVLRERGVRADSFDGQLLHEPSRLRTGAGGFYKVFTPFWNALSAGPEPRDPIDAPDRIKAFKADIQSLSLTDLALVPTSPDWSGGLREAWTPGEAGAATLLDEFLSDNIDVYAQDRDFPAIAATSRLSPHLAHGEITPYQIFAALRDAVNGSPGAAKFRKEIGWREFCHHLLFHNRDLHLTNFQPAFDAFPWADDKRALQGWRKGRTGYPIVDAGMRELWLTGAMHNRVRMIAASFLTKHLLIDWREGERWFWDTLVDADPASNPANWQWVAGSGADAAPYFRIFNPVLQGEKFDPAGTYVRRFVPELEKLPDNYLHKPWQAPPAVLGEAGVTLGQNYPMPVVDHKKARQRALAAYAMTRSGAQ
jgi:deoxyribodipyrimidine photo-lyase